MPLKIKIKYPAKSKNRNAKKISASRSTNDRAENKFEELNEQSVWQYSRMENIFG